MYIPREAARISALISTSSSWLPSRALEEGNPGVPSSSSELGASEAARLGLRQRLFNEQQTRSRQSRSLSRSHLNVTHRKFVPA